MFVRTLILISFLLATAGIPSATGIRCFGILQFRPDGTRQSAVLYSDGTLDKAFISEKDTHYSDGHLILETPEREKILQLALQVYNSSKASESASINYDQLILSRDQKDKVIVFIETSDAKTKRFERHFDKAFDSPELKELDAFLDRLLEK